ncbi:hypothetical protein MRB53_022589 [Persea americana]|uniref:Uncharacterized protein n=1 Tax=Persea americana TaxID=3435 RepID=A0ACC2L789_PERAE|nr:hypothetical protein MRB53_022589 [Persea americana]
MVNPRRLVNMASKVAAIGRRRRIMLPRNDSSKNSTTISKSRPEKGNFVVYTADGRRFAVPLSYLENPIFIELLKMSEEEFGLPGNGPIKLPCDGVFMDYVMSLVERCVCEEVEKALVISALEGVGIHHPCFNKNRPTNKYLCMDFEEAICAPCEKPLHGFSFFTICTYS